MKRGNRPRHTVDVGQSRHNLYLAEWDRKLPLTQGKSVAAFRFKDLHKYIEFRSSPLLVQKLGVEKGGETAPFHTAPMKGRAMGPKRGQPAGRTVLIGRIHWPKKTRMRQAFARRSHLLAMGCNHISFTYVRVSPSTIILYDGARFWLQVRPLTTMPSWMGSNVARRVALSGCTS